MKRNGIFITLSFALLFCSCSSVNLRGRKGKDIHLSAKSFDKLSGNFKNSNNDTINPRGTLYNNFNYDEAYKQKNLIVTVTPIDKNNIQLKVLIKDIPIDSVTIKGKYSQGYFKLKPKKDFSFIAGPLIWTFSDQLMYLGITNENKLIILKAGGGVMFFILFPMFAANGA